MPWQKDDVEEHVKGLTDKKKDIWVHTANRALKAALEKGEDEKQAEASAIRQANAVVKQVKESVSQDAIDLALDMLQPLREVMNRDRHLFEEAIDVVRSLTGFKEGTTDSPTGDTLKESAQDALFQGEFFPLVEAKKGPIVGPDNRVKVKLIQPGWGNSAYYSPDVLAKGAKLFEGAKMYWNHPTDDEVKGRPEGDLDKLAGQIVTTPAFDHIGPQGPGVYAEAQVFAKYKDAVEELAPHIGLSIRAVGKAKKGRIGDREGLIAESIQGAKSVDFVTEPAAGGRILQMFEAAGRTIEDKEESEVTFEELTVEQLKESRSDLVEAILKENKPAEQPDKELMVKLQESANKIARLEEQIMLGQAKEVIGAELNEAKLPKKTRDRLFREALTGVVTDDKGELDEVKLRESLKGAIEEAQAEIAEIAGSGKIRGMGESSRGVTKTDEQLSAELTESFKGLGFDDAAASAAAIGR